MLIEIVLVVFLFMVAVTATVAVKVGFRAVDFIVEARRILEKLERDQERILKILEDGRRDGPESDGEK